MLRMVVLTISLMLIGLPKPMRQMELTRLDAEAIGGATFQSHNQKVVQNRYGIFTTHLRSKNEGYTAQTWRFSRSTDGGKTFTTLFEATHPTNPPVLETDSKGNLYLIRPDFVDGAAYLYRFLASNQFQNPEITKIPQGAAGKYAACIDEKRKRLYLFSHNNTFHTLSLEGRLLKSINLLKEGPDAALQYPLLYLDAEGKLHAAWTTLRHGRYLYWDIHHIYSEDGGETWRNMGGGGLTVPIVADQHGAATRISLDDEYEHHTWLSSFVVVKGKAHFLYLTQGTKPPRQHYIRYDVESGKREQDTFPQFRGDKVNLFGLDGFFAVGKRGQLYCIGNDAGRIACLVSLDNGKTWQDHARSEQTFNVYAVGGFRSVTSDGYIIGTFTDFKDDKLKPAEHSQVYFFRFQD